MSIRKALLSDISDIMTIINKNVKIMNESGNYQWDSYYPLANDFINDINNNVLYVYINNNNEIQGVIALTTDQSIEYSNVGWDLSIPAIVPHRLAVSPDSKGQGIAKKLLKHGELLSNQLGYNRIRIDTNSKNNTMQYLLKQLDYKYSGDTSLNNKDPSMKFQCYEKIL